ncbi:MAG: LysM peptidoglycan-binding domain-containing protein [Chlamydiales bacterium]
MSRRDTIIIAVLVNAGLLMILFATATRSGEKKERHERKTELAKTLPSLEIPSLEIIEQTPFVAEEDVLEKFLSAPVEPITTFTHTEELVFAPREIEPQLIEKYQPPVPEDNTPYVSVTIKKGDFLEKIAKEHNTTVAGIMKANNLNTTNLKVGQVLKVPVRGRGAAVPAAVEGEYYVVKDGDNPWLIASKNRVRLEDLLRINGLDEQKARRLRPGDRLKIR